MRSAELSGVGSRGFSSVFRHISPLTYAVALTAFVAATIFVVTDAFRTFDDIASSEAMMTRLGAAQPLLGRQFVANALEPIVRADSGASIGELLQRSAGAYGLALLFGVAAYRRRPVEAPSADAPYADLLATIPFGIACWTAEGRLISCNEQYRARLNAESVDVRAGASYAASVKRFVQGGFMQLVTEDDRNRVLELHREDGTCLMIDERPLASGGFVTLVTDITETRRTDHLLSSIREEQRVLARRYHEEKLRAEAASQSKTAFLAHLSHDIRTPLNHIIGFAELMRHETYGPLGDDRYVDYVDSIRTSGERLLAFFASTLDLAELEGGRRVLNPLELDVDALLVGVTQRFSSQAQRKGIALALGAPTGARLLADRFSLERMLGNLVENAIRFTPPRGSVTLAAYAATDGVVLEVTDTGIGMSPERLSAVSQPFAFGDAALTRDRDGSGLGLAIARTIAELSGGRLAIDSRPGLGTTVAVSLPLLDTRAPAVDIAAE
jgi:two-component system cell cycle sensor histidine kinase PleC